MSILTEFLNPIYLNQDYINDLKETMRAKPNTPYIVLDNFFKADVLSRIIEEHSDLRFDLHADSTEATNRKIRLPFDGAAADCDSDSVLGKLLYSKEWYQFCSELVQVKPKKIIPVIKIRFNAENARGY